MPMTDNEWAEILLALQSGRATIASWPPTAPNPAAQRCQECRHRTLAHLRAAQETWLQVARHITSQSSKGIRLLHPWALFAAESYTERPWQEHFDKFLVDRDEWIALVENPDTDRRQSTHFNGRPVTLEQLTEKLVSHEAHHLKDFG